MRTTEMDRVDHETQIGARNDGARKKPPRAGGSHRGRKKDERKGDSCDPRKAWQGERKTQRRRNADGPGTLRGRPGKGRFWVLKQDMKECGVIQ
ncbi:unnamed protein product [Lampetra planeri]